MSSDYKDDIIEALKVSQLDLRAENARLQEQVEKADSEREEAVKRTWQNEKYRVELAKLKGHQECTCDQSDANCTYRYSLVAEDRAERAEALAKVRGKALALGCEHGRVMTGPQLLEWIANKLIELGTTEGVGPLRAKADAERNAIDLTPEEALAKETT